jgi:plastocyanin
VKTRSLTGPLAALAAALLLGGAVAAQSPAAPAASPAPSMPPMGTSPAPSAAAPATAATAVTIMNFAFSPASISVPVGSTVTWTNQDSTAHTVTADDGSFDSGSLAPGATFSQAFDTPGTFAYHCNIHSSMHGTVTVVAAATPASMAPSMAPAASVPAASTTP